MKVSNTSGNKNSKSVVIKALPTVLKRVKRSVLATFFPVRCMGCDQLFVPTPVDTSPRVQPSEKCASGFENLRETGNTPISGVASSTPCGACTLLSQWVCADCIAGWKPVTSPMCKMCGLPFKSRQGGDHLCGECIKTPKYFQSARSAAFYTPLTMDLIHRFKYNRKIQLAKPLGEVLAKTFLKFWEIDDIDVVVPVPLHFKRFRQRGFNQAYLLAKAFLSQIKNTQHASCVKIEKELLYRTSPTVSQTGLKRKSRLKNIKNAFCAMKPAVVNAQRILLIDDIYTTGATVNECAKTLHNNGASRIDVLTIARAV